MARAISIDSQIKSIRVDGTYCATAGGAASPSIPPIQSFSSDLAIGTDPPATLGAITFNSDGTNCIALFRRMSCGGPLMQISGKIGVGIALRAAAILVAASPVASPVAAWAEDANSRAVEQYSCKDVIREHGSNRDVTIAYLHGYLLGKSGRSSFDIEDLHKQTSVFIEYCLDNPGERAVDAMAKTKG
jgi:HdeA/HdeB family